MRIGLLCSGGLGLSLLEHLCTKHDIEFVCTDRSSHAIITFCEDRNIPAFVGNPRNGTTKSFIKDKNIEALISVNYLFVIESDLINHPEKVAFNIHGSLLPKYRGRTPHVWAIINNEKMTGITAHVIDEGCDTGAIIEQIKIPIDDYDTGYSILEKYNREYQSLVDRVIEKITSNTLELIPQNNLNATYYGKRSPEDGLINWGWHKERIYNWVRAQASPYPGAFTFLDGEKIVIDKISFSDRGFTYDMPNGLILETENEVLVKSPNGVIKLEAIRSGKSVLKINKILSNG